MRKILIFMLILAVFAASVRYMSPPRRFEADFYGLFDTWTHFIGYAHSQKKFDSQSSLVYDELLRLHRLFDIYNTYEGTNNLKTVNDFAGIAPVAVCDEIIGMLSNAQEAYRITGGTVNVALGPVLSVWHTYREDAITNPELARRPPDATLFETIPYTDIDRLLIDTEHKTVFLDQSGMSLDVGSVAKGYAAQRIISILRESGVKSCLLNMGGNVVVLGAPLERSNDYWNVGIRHPNALDTEANAIIGAIGAKNMSVVTSGDYQRYYEADGMRYCHIIDPATLMPAALYRGVTVAHADSCMADILSTALFIMPQEEGHMLAEAHNAAAIWVLPDLSVLTNGYYDVLSGNYDKSTQ